ncbi:hypothetical protein [Paraburkholderia sp. J8-2]|uniref:hypothetical protein n=1 Tax=Paraburkholderia sp. J8-2 TaxID=2805440 RepID=UPI002AB658FC|nr:hypothetical protein [Paraburkholderia sp. J8-2]
MQLYISLVAAIFVRLQDVGRLFQGSVPTARALRLNGVMKVFGNGSIASRGGLSAFFPAFYAFWLWM